MYAHREESYALAKQAAEKVAALHKEDMKERTQLKILVAQVSVSQSQFVKVWYRTHAQFRSPVESHK